MNLELVIYWNDLKMVMKMWALLVYVNVVPVCVCVCVCVCVRACIGV